MPIQVEHPDYGLLEFPDGTSTATINNALIKLDAQEGQQYSKAEIAFRAAERGFTSSSRGVEQKTTGDIAQGLGTDTTDAQKERELRVMLEQNPGLGYASLIGGSIADPLTLHLAPLKLIKARKLYQQYMAQGMAAGGVGGALEPTYDDYGDSQVVNIMAGVGLGGALGGVLGKTISKFTETDVVDAGSGLVKLPQKTLDRDLNNGRLEAEAKQAIADVEVAGIEARVGASMQQSGAINLQKGQAENIIKPVENLPQPPQRISNPVETMRAELGTLAGRAVPKKELSVLQGSLDSVTAQLAKAQKIAASRKTVAGKARAEATIQKIKTTRDTLATKVNQAKAGDTAQRQLNILESGRIEKLPKSMQARLAGLKTDAGVQPTQLAEAVAVPQQRLAEPVEQAITAINTRVASKINPIETKPIVPLMADATPLVAPRVPLGLDARPGVGSTGTRPSAQFDATSPDAPGAAAVQRAVLGRATPPPSDRADIIGATQAERKFHSRLQGESAEQLVRLRNETHGRYSWNNVVNAGVAVQNKILKDYNDLAEWLAENQDKVFNAAELEAITPLLKEAQQRVLDARKVVYYLVREGKLDSPEGLRVAQDLQYYNFINNAGFVAQKTKASNIMSQFRKMNKEITLQEGDLQRGKEITNIMFGVQC